MARTIYIRCIYGIFGREITKYTVIYGVYIRFWPTLVKLHCHVLNVRSKRDACRVWDFATGECKAVLPTLHTDWVRGVAISADGVTCYSTGNDKTVR